MTDWAFIWNKYRHPRTFFPMLFPQKSTFNGFTFYHTSDTMPYPENFVKDVAPREMYDLLMLESGRTAIDAGACIGFYAIQFSRGFKNVVAFEPHPDNGELLAKNIQANKADNVEFHGWALSDHNELAVPFHIKNHYKASSSLIPNHLGQPLDKVILVNAYKLDNFGYSDVDLLKVDVEGMEIPVLRGAKETIAKTHPVLAVEVHKPREGDPCQCSCCRLIEGFGYRIVDTRTHELKSQKDFPKDTAIHWVLAK